MRKNKIALIIIAAIQFGCASTTKEEISSLQLQRQINDLQIAVSNLKRATESDLSKLNSNDMNLVSRVQQAESALESARKKIESFCVVAKNGRWEEFRSAGDPRCTVR